jgi:hypothetical protein
MTCFYELFCNLQPETAREAKNDISRPDQNLFGWPGFTSESFEEDCSKQVTELFKGVPFRQKLNGLPSPSSYLTGSWRLFLLGVPAGQGEQAA